MEIVVSTRNITFACGKKFLEKNRIVARRDDYSSKNFRSKSKQERDSYDSAPIDGDEMDRYFRKATAEEVEMFNQGIKVSEKSEA